MKRVLAVAVFGIVISGAVVGQQRTQPSQPKREVSPIIVVNKSFVNQTAPLPETTLYTPETDGTYRVSLYVAVQPPQPSGSSVDVRLTWTDEFQTHTRSAFTTDETADWVLPVDTKVLRAKTGTPITLSADPGCCGIVWAFPFSLYVTVEDLD